MNFCQKKNIKEKSNPVKKSVSNQKEFQNSSQKCSYECPRDTLVQE